MVQEEEKDDDVWAGNPDQSYDEWQQTEKNRAAL